MRQRYKNEYILELDYSISCLKNDKHMVKILILFPDTTLTADRGAMIEADSRYMDQ